MQAMLLEVWDLNLGVGPSARRPLVDAWRLFGDLVQSRVEYSIV